MTRTFLTRALAGAILFVAAATTAGAQTPTPENTVIANTATASFTDANGNTYSNVSASVSVTVGFKAGVDAQSPATQTPVSGSTGNTLPVTIVNNGNGTDQFSLAVTPPAGVTIASYTFNSTSYPTLVALNAALSAANVTAGANEVVTIVYSVAAANSGSGSFSITATSVRTNTTNDATTTTLNYTAQAVVAVAPTSSTSSRLPSGPAHATQYTQDFTVTNSGSAGGTFNVTVNKTANINSATGAATVTVAAGASATITVTYTVLNTATVGATGTITIDLAGTGGAAGVTATSGAHTVTVIRPTVVMTKEVFRANGTTAIGGSDRVLPGEVITYKISVQNTGTAAGATISVSDALPAQVTFVASSLTPDAAGWTLSEAAGTITGALAALPTGTTRSFTFQVTVK